VIQKLKFNKFNISSFILNIVKYFIEEDKLNGIKQKINLKIHKYAYALGCNPPIAFSSGKKKISKIIGINKRIWHIVFSDRKIKKFIK
jgi:hypothetical protein